MRVLVTGATSLLGATAVGVLQERGHEVAVLQRRPSGLDCHEVLGDIRDRVAVDRALTGCQAVLHCAAKVGITGRPREFVEINVQGTANLLTAARAAGVQRFVQVSSPSVAHAGHALVGADAEAADPERARSAYSRTKAQAELLALAADDPQFAVTAVRPHLVWGPGDEQLVARIVHRAQRKRLVLIGNGCALIDTTYLDNAATALVCAVERAADPLVHGRAFVVSNGEPRTVADMLSGIAAAAGAPAPSRYVSLGAARAAGALVAGAWVLLRRRDEPPMTPFLAEQLGTAHWFDQRQVRRALAWQPTITIDEGLRRLSDWYRTR